MLPIAGSCFRENIRTRSMYILAVVGFLAVLVALSSGARVSTGGSGNLLDTPQGAARVGVAVTGFFSALAAVMVCMNSIAREFERRTTHLVLVRPVQRWRYALEILAGNLLTSWTFLALMLIALWLGLRGRGIAVSGADFAGAGLSLAVGVAALSAVTTLFGSRMAGPAAGFLGVTAYAVGVLKDQLALLVEAHEGLVRVLVRAALAIAPPVSELSRAAAEMAVRAAEVAVTAGTAGTMAAASQAAAGAGAQGSAAAVGAHAAAAGAQAVALGFQSEFSTVQGGLVYLLVVSGLVAVSLYGREV